MVVGCIRPSSIQGISLQVITVLVVADQHCSRICVNLPKGKIYAVFFLVRINISSSQGVRKNYCSLFVSQKAKKKQKTITCFVSGRHIIFYLGKPQLIDDPNKQIHFLNLYSTSKCFNVIGEIRPEPTCNCNVLYVGREY